MLGSPNEREIQRIISLLRDTKELKDELAGILFMDCACLPFWRFFFFLGWGEYNAGITKWNRDTKELKLFPDTALILLKKKKRIKGQLIPQLPFHKFIRSLIDISSLWKIMLYKAFFICVSLAYMAHKTSMFTNSISQLPPDPLTSITDQKQWLQFAWRILNCACEIQSQNAIFSIRL